MIDAVGFQGADCEKATAFPEQALGQTASKQKKPEHYRQERRRQQRHANQGRQAPAIPLKHQHGEQ